jgi:hypothetical protein
MALTSRYVVIQSSQRLLSEDNCQRVVISENIGCFVSLVHFTLRNVVLKTTLEVETPLTKLGGAQARPMK